MRLLITGATGLIGRAFIKRLQITDHQIISVSRKGGEIAGHRAGQLDLTSADQVRAYFADMQADVVVHLASDIPVSGTGDWQDCFFNNMSMTTNILQAALAVKAKKIIYASSINLYNKKARIFKETDPITPDNYYAASKYLGELMCEQVSHQAGISSTMLRISSPYDFYYRRLTVIHRFIQAALKGEDISIWGTGKRTQNFVHADDVVNAILLATRPEAVGVFNIASGQSVSMTELAEKTIEYAAPTKSKIIFADQPDPQDDYRPEIDISRARDVLGYEPAYDIDKGLKYLVSMYAESGMK